MTIVIFGLTISSAWGNGHATLWRGLCRALHQRGHQVRFFEKDATDAEQWGQKIADFINKTLSESEQD